MATRDVRRTYLATTVALFVLLGLTVGASFLSLGAYGPLVALSIAAAKALLVALFFMHLARRGGVTRLFALGGIVWLSVLFALTLADYAARGGEAVQRRSWSEVEPPQGAPDPRFAGRTSLTEPVLGPSAR